MNNRSSVVRRPIVPGWNDTIATSSRRATSMFYTTRRGEKTRRVHVVFHGRVYVATSDTDKYPDELRALARSHGGTWNAPETCAKCRGTGKASPGARRLCPYCKGTGLAVTR